MAGAGADGRDLVRLALKQGMWRVVIGSAIGVFVAANVTRPIGNLLYGVGPSNAPTFVFAIATFLLVGLIASDPPARRVARQDPPIALRQQ